MEDTNCSFFDTAAAPVSLRLAPYLRRLPERIKAKTQEIRLRVNRPVCLSVDGKIIFWPGTASPRSPSTASPQKRKT